MLLHALAGDEPPRPAGQRGTVAADLLPYLRDGRIQPRNPLRLGGELNDFAGKRASSRGGERWPLLIGLRGDLGAGKTTFVRALLRGLGYQARVPSPTYTLLEQYTVGGLAVVHLDLYRLAARASSRISGLRDWLEAAATWVAIEWPERAPELADGATCSSSSRSRRRVVDGVTVAGRTRARNRGVADRSSDSALIT